VLDAVRAQIEVTTVEEQVLPSVRKGYFEPLPRGDLAEGSLIEGVAVAAVTPRVEAHD
jgi:hypothetical protein